MSRKLTPTMTRGPLRVLRWFYPGLGIKRWLIGNTAERILDDLRCDVLIVKPTTFRNRVPRATRGVHLLTAPMPGAFGYY